MTHKKSKAKEPMAWTRLSCDSDYPRDVKFCPSCHIVSPYESGAFPSVKGQSELARLRAALSAMTTERNAILKATNEHTGSCFAERDQLRVDLAGATKDRDDAWRVLRDFRLDVDKADAIYLKEIATLTQDAEIARKGHEGQTRNTMAFYDDCERYKTTIADLTTALENLLDVSSIAEVNYTQKGEDALAGADAALDRAKEVKP